MQNLLLNKGIPPLNKGRCLKGGGVRIIIKNLPLAGMG
jgi:hypothetical protein